MRPNPDDSVSLTKIPSWAPGQFSRPEKSSQSLQVVDKSSGKGERKASTDTPCFSGAELEVSAASHSRDFSKGSWDLSVPKTWNSSVLKRRETSCMSLYRGA